jgi:hypothetical protein
VAPGPCDGTADAATVAAGFTLATKSPLPALSPLSPLTFM